MRVHTDRAGRRARATAWSLVVAGLALGAALEISVPAAAGPGDDAQQWMEVGWRSYSAGALAQAQVAFIHAATAAPDWATPAVWLGAVAIARGNWDQAERWFEEALARHPSLAEAGYAQAWLARLGVQVSRPRMRVRTAEEYAAFVRTANPSLSWGQARWVGAALLAAAGREGLDPRLLAAVVYVESHFEHRVISEAGAEGLGQLLPGTAARLGVNPRDPWENLVGAARLLHEDYEEFHSVPLTLAAYNAGSDAVRRWGGIPPYPETQWYVWAVLWVFGGLSA